MAPGAAPEPVQAPASISAMDDLLPSEHDLLYEEELLRNPYSLRMWDRYIQARKDAPPKRRYLLYERALKALPGSYKVSSCKTVAESMIHQRGLSRLPIRYDMVLRPAFPIDAPQPLDGLADALLCCSCGLRTWLSGGRRCGGCRSTTRASTA